MPTTRCAVFDFKLLSRICCVCRRYRKKAEKDEEYIRQVKSMGETVEHSIMQNIAVDIYQASSVQMGVAEWSPQRVVVAALW